MRGAAGNKNIRGASLIELVMVMLVLALFGVTIYTLIATGADTQKRIMNEKNAQSDARVALSYINVRLRQNDESGKIEIKKVDITGENAILIQNRSSGYEYDTWIYNYEGGLYECLVDPGEQPNELFSFYVIDAELFETSIDGESGRITNTVYYSFDGEWKHLSSSIYLRSR